MGTGLAAAADGGNPTAASTDAAAGTSASADATAAAGLVPSTATAGMEKQFQHQQLNIRGVAHPHCDRFTPCPL